MIWLIAKKDFLLNLLSVRFIIGFVLCLLVIPFTVIVSVDNYQNQVRVYKIEQAQADKEMKESRVWSHVRPTVVQEPEPLSIFSMGISNNIGNKVKTLFMEYPLFPDGHTNTRDNPLLNAFFCRFLKSRSYPDFVAGTGFFVRRYHSRTGRRDNEVDIYRASEPYLFPGR